MLLREHKPHAGQLAFRTATNRPFVTASIGAGAAGHNVARRGSLVFRQAADRPQPDRHEQPSPQQAPEQPKRPLIQRRRPSASPFRKSARSRQRTADCCAACGGRGFQIVEEELKPCPACDGQNWSPPSLTPHFSQADLADPPRSHFWRPDSPPSGGGSAAPEVPDLYPPRPAKGRPRRKGPKTQAERDKISATMKGRKVTDEHKLNMSRSQKESWNDSRRSQVSKTLKDRPKVCSFCGETGHNKLGCPTLHPEKAQEKLATAGTRGGRSKTTGSSVTASVSSSKESITEIQQEPDAEALSGRKFACSHCGEVGHNKRRCPELAHEREKEEEQKRRKLRGPLWGLAGVEEQRMPGGRKRVLVFPVPVQVQDTVSQAAGAVIRAQEAGIRRQRLEMLLPQAGVTSAQGSWPGGIRQQAQVAIPTLIEPLLRQLKQQEALQGRMTAEWMDESDCVGAWQNERLAAVVFPTADTLSQVRHMARVKGPHRLMLVINPQWQMDGQIVSDFGFGRAKADAQKFLTSFQDVYCLERVRVMGDDIRLLKCYPGDWQVHYTWPNGKGTLLVGVEPTRPSYARLVEMLKGVPNTRASRSWVDRVLDINNLKGISGDANSSLTRGSYSDGAGPSAAAPPSAPLAAMPAAEQKTKRPSLRQRLQEAFLEQQADDGRPASELDTPAADKLYRAAGLPAPDALTKQQARRATAQASATGGAAAAAAVSNPTASKAKHDPDHSQMRKTPANIGDGGAADDFSIASAAVDRVPTAGQGALPASEQMDPRVADPQVQQRGSSWREGQAADGTHTVAGAISRSIDGDDDGMLDRFGSVDIITGKPVRDLKLDPVLQLVKWRESLFGSRDSVSESLDAEDDDGPST
ncbi:hypothetical protein ABBQ38_005658 [Trebouxia sp. C0009 RCD-2024]